MPDMPCRKPVTEEDIARARATAQPLARAVAAAQARAGDGAMVLAWISDLHVHAHRPYQRMSSIFTDVDAGDGEVAVGEGRDPVAAPAEAGDAGARSAVRGREAPRCGSGSPPGRAGRPASR